MKKYIGSVLARLWVRISALVFVCLLLSGSIASQKTIHFDEPIDALSVRLPHDNAVVMIDTGDGWHRFAIEKEFDPILMESDLVMFAEPTSSVVLRGQLANIRLHPIRVSTEPATYKLAAVQFYRSPRILSRTDWGADEHFLIAGSQIARSDIPSSSTDTAATSGSSSSNRKDDCEMNQVNYPNDFITSKTITHDASGEKYRWAQRYSPTVKLLVVHHTAQKVIGDARPAVERMRALYDYHANSRGWGDIGYHYIVDEQGGIYEGRNGGKNVVGGHVYCGNVGTVGVALMGNFEEEQPTQQQIQSLQWLLGHLGDMYDINLNRNVSYHGKNVRTILRHKDLISTECPGFYMSNAIAQVRSNVIAGDFTKGVTFPKIAKKQDYKDQSEKRLTTRLEQAGQELSRRFYRTKRQIRTAERLDNPRVAQYQEQLATSSNIQRKRSPSQKPMRPTGTLYRPARNNQAPTTLHRTDEGNIRIRLSYTGNTAEISSDTVANVNGNSAKIVRFGKDGNQCVAVSGSQTLGEGIVRMDPGNGILTVQSWKTKWNKFRGVIECAIVDGQIVLINDLPLEQYMAGLSEQPDTEPREKQKAFTIAARSYAAHYMQPGNIKFPGKPYHGSDTGASFQSYSGVMYEEDNAKWVQSVLDTKNNVLMKDNKIVKAAYFSSDDGHTRSPAQNGWKNFPFAEVFSSKPDPWCKGMTLRGHGVGMSGCGAEGQANQGKKYTEILEYYYPGTEIERVFSPADY
ncbi:MAG: N-acetylmuramoyl-L-alanine amidase [bacterium]|nr:N-acetylmuramoyl-L-alanine amidase [bacterium]